jgi:hypothetical protein
MEPTFSVCTLRYIFGFHRGCSLPKIRFLVPFVAWLWSWDGLDLSRSTPSLTPGPSQGPPLHAEGVGLSLSHQTKPNQNKTNSPPSPTHKPL